MREHPHTFKTSIKIPLSFSFGIFSVKNVSGNDNSVENNSRNTEKIVLSLLEAEVPETLKPLGEISKQIGVLENVEERNTKSNKECQRFRDPCRD